MSKKKVQGYWDKINALRTVLSNLYPHTFVAKGSKDRKKPLKVGILEDILKENPGLSPIDLKEALKDYTHGPKYTVGMINNKKRVNLRGKDVGFVTFEDVEHAKQKWRATEQAFNERKKRYEQETHRSK